MTDSESIIGAAARAHGAVMTESEGMAIVGHFGDPAAEYRHLCAGAALVDLSLEGVVRLDGGDRGDFLQGMLSNDIKARVVGQGCRALVLTDQGKVVADVTALVDEDAVVLVGAATGVAAAVPALERYIVADDVELHPSGASEHVFGLFGPDAATVLVGRGVSTPPVDDYDHVSVDAHEGPIRIVRVPGPGVGGYLCVMPTAGAVAWWSGVVESGAAQPVGYEAHELLRIESGVARLGRDVTSDTLALETPFEDAISFQKGCYLGQEIVERVTARGKVNRRLVGILLVGGAAESPAPRPNDKLLVGDREVGWITSAAWSWDRGQFVGLGYVRRQHCEPGTTLDVHMQDGIAPATVSALPFA